MSAILKSENEMFYKIVGLSPKKIKVTWYEKQDKKHILTVKGKHKTCKCPMCGKRTSKRNGYTETTLKPLWKHLLISDGTMIELKLVKRYFRCGKCKVWFMERFEFESETWERTKTFEDYVKFSRGHMSGAQIAKNTQCSGWLVHSILKDISPDDLNNRGFKIMEELNEIYLWIDEHSFRGRNMVLVITDIKAKKVLAVLEDITNWTLRDWFNSIPDEIKDKIKGISTDMNKLYKNVAEEKIEGIVWTVDKYHLVQEANRMVDDVRVLTIWLTKQWFMKEEDFLKNKNVTKKLLKKKKETKKN